MSSVVIKAENIGKLYRLGQVGTGTISHDLNRWWNKVRGKEDPYLRIGQVNDRESNGGQIVWALKDISFEVNQGDVLGIIGKNGAGKSTLLKILSQVTAPSAGIMKVKGRIASLLEVGTGFHPELSGRENIFLNGAILGMTKKEIRAKFDEIVDFSGVERYVDTPVKRYSSGMYVRLAFAVAAHLEPEILIVDEVLAVGDSEFQKKCLGKMKDVSGQGRTVLFVSHNMGAVNTLCNKGLLLDKGRVLAKDEMSKVIIQYSKVQSNINNDLENTKSRSGLGDVRFSRIDIISEGDVIKSGNKIIFSLSYKVKKHPGDQKCNFALGVWNEMGTPMFMLSNAYTGQDIKPEQNEGKVNFELDKLRLNAGTYAINLLVSIGDLHLDFIENAFEFTVEDGNYFDGNIFYPPNYGGYYQDYKITCG